MITETTSCLEELVIIAVIVILHIKAVARARPSLRMIMYVQVTANA
jgi:hypothetical protein